MTSEQGQFDSLLHILPGFVRKTQQKPAPDLKSRLFHIINLLPHFLEALQVPSQFDYGGLPSPTQTMSATSRQSSGHTVG